MTKKTKSNKPLSAYKAVATLVITNLPNMTIKQRSEITLWLRSQADAIDREGHSYGKSFTARYMM